MCKITKKSATETIGKVCDYEEGMITDNTELAEAYADVYALRKELEKYEKALKSTLVEREIDPIYFPEKEIKVLLEEGRKSTQYEMHNIITKCAENNLLDDLALVTNVVTSKLSDDMEPIKGIVKEFSFMTEGATTTKIKKMTKKELMEQS